MAVDPVTTINTISYFGSPGLLLMAGGLLMLALPVKLRDHVSLLLPCLVLLDIWQLSPGDRLDFVALGHSFHLMHVHAYSTIFATAFALAALGGAMFAFGKGRHIELPAAFVYAGSALCVVYAGDMLTFLIFWELMAMGSLLVVWAGGTPMARRAGMRYAAMHFLGGVLLMEGITTYIGLVGHDEITAFAIHLPSLFAWPVAADPALATLSAQQQTLMQIAIWLIFIGILINLAAPPFSPWLADSYPEASPSGTVFLSAFTTKTSVFALLMLFPGTELLIYLGLFMVFYGIVYAMLENDIRRILSYSIVNQVGFMTVAIGIGTPLALLGAAAHAFCHIIYKGLLMMSAGAVIEQTGKRLCTELGGLYHSMKLTTICGIIGALAISSFPLTSGFISKSLISSAAADEHLTTIWFLLMAASAGVFLHAGIKYPWFVFFQRDSGLRPKDPGGTMNAAMIGFSLLCLIPGLWPEMVYHLLPVMPDYEPNTVSHWVAQLQLLLFSGLAFFIMLPWLQRSLTISLDIDWVWRVPAYRFLRWSLWVLTCGVEGIKELGLLLYRLGARIISTYHCPEGIFARNAVAGASVMWVSIMLGIYLLIYFWGSGLQF